MIIHSNDTELIQSGCLPITVGGFWYFFDSVNGAYDTSRISETAIKRAAGGLTDDSIPLLLDIETFSLRTDADNARRNLRIAIDTWKHCKPNMQVGIYAQVPERNFWTPVKRAMYLKPYNANLWPTAARDFLEWSAFNRDNAKAVLENADFVCPSVYALDARYMADWAVYAAANIEQSQFGTPIWPIVQPVYPTNQPIPLNTWKQMIRLCCDHPLTDRLIVHSSASQIGSVGWRGVVTAETITN